MLSFVRFTMTSPRKAHDKRIKTAFLAFHFLYSLYNKNYKLKINFIIKIIVFFFKI